MSVHMLLVKMPILKHVKKNFKLSSAYKMQKQEFKNEITIIKLVRLIL